MKAVRSIGSFAVAAMIALALGTAASGCGSSEERGIWAAVETWREGALTKDVDKIMSIVSEDFSHEGRDYSAGSKAALREYVVGAIEAGGFDGVEVILEDTEIDIEGAEAAVYPVKWAAPRGPTVLELFLTHEEASWRLTDMAIGTREQRRGMPKDAAEAMAWFDENGDGKISTEEMPEFLRGRAKLFDADGNGNLTQEELEAAFKRMSPKGSPRPAAPQTAEQLMAYMDTNGDGKITMDEAPEQLKTSFALVDKNGDGGIDVKEAQVMADYNNRRQSRSR